MIPLKTFRNLSAEKQARITRAAVEEFSDRGYRGASINSLVQHLGIAKGSIFQYFGDKKGLFLFVFGHAMEMVKKYLRTVRRQTEAEDVFTRLQKTMMAGVIFINKHPRLYSLYLKMLFEKDMPMRDELLSSLRRYSFEYLRSLLETGRQRGELRADIDLDKTSFVLDAIMDRFLQAHTVRHLDAGLDLYQADADQAGPWVEDLVGFIRLGIGVSQTPKKIDCRAGNEG